MKVLGLDCGIASVGWAILEILWNDGSKSYTYRIIACGSYCFNQPIVGGTGKDKFTSLKSAKRQRISHMHFLRRKKVKMNDVRRALLADKILDDAKSDSLARAMLRVSPKGQEPQITPYDLRAAALNRHLTKDELAVVIGHLVAHPGPRTSEKNKSGSNEPEKGKIRSAVSANSQYQQKGYQTVGEMLARDEQFFGQKHNREKEWKYSVGRNDVIYELNKIFSLQSNLGNTLATDGLRDTLLAIMLRRKEPKFDYYPVEKCRFIEDEQRAASRSYSFERFRFSQTLSHLSIERDGPLRPTPNEIGLAMEDFGIRPKTTFTDLRKIWSLTTEDKFVGIKSGDEKGRDFATAKGESTHGTNALQKILGDDWKRVKANPKILDSIAYEISFATREDVVLSGLQKLDLGGQVLENLMDAYRNGEFDGFVKAGDISAKAASLLTQHLQEGLPFSEACQKEGWNHTAKSASMQENRNPVTRHAVREYLAMIDEITTKFGLPDEIHIEMARDVAWSEAKKLEYTDSIDDARRKNIRIAKECEECIGTKPTGTQILKYRLAKEQGFKSLYSGESLSETMRTGFDGLEIEHILPESRFYLGGDKSNLVVCLTGENANKHTDTPFEWSLRDAKFDWDEFRARIKVSHDLPKRKKTLLQMQSTDDIEQGFKKRNLVDTQYAIKLLNAELRSFFEGKFPKSEAPRIVGRPGRLVSWLRRGWGLNHLKHDLEQKRLNDARHHAVDAIIVAAIDDRMIQVASNCAKYNEMGGHPRDRFKIDPPWHDMHKDVEASIEAISIVARAKKDGFGGALHKDTTYGLTLINGQLKKRERVSVDKDLTLKHLERFADRSEKGHIKDILKQWIADGHPKDHLPTWKYGINSDGTEQRMPIRKITLITNDDPAVVLKRISNSDSEGGQPFATYDRDDMVQVDVFRAVGTKVNAKYIFVPIYPHQMNDEVPPSKFFKRNATTAMWPSLHADDEFITSLSRLDLIEVKSKGKIAQLYYRSFHSNKGSINVSPLFSLHKDEEIVIAQTDIEVLRKLSVNRLGEISAATDRKRTWRGKVCI